MGGVALNVSAAYGRRLPACGGSQARRDGFGKEATPAPQANTAGPQEEPSKKGLPAQS